MSGRLISLLGDARNIEGLQLVRKTLNGAKWKDHRRFIDNALMRAGKFKGADVRELVSVGNEPSRPLPHAVSYGGIETQR